jgi:hypothetical protein
MARKLNVSGSMKLQDYETFGANEVETRPFSNTITLDDDQLEEAVEIVEGTGGEVRGELIINAQLLNNNRIRVSVGIWLYEGTSESTSDLDGERHSSFIVRKGQIVSKTYMVYNTDEGDDDFVRVTMTCKNLPVA